jgi:hypothetical protein
MDDARAIGICYRLLSRMDDRAQDAAVGWLLARLESDREKSAMNIRGISTPDKAAIRKMMGDATMSLMALLKVTGADIARRPVEVRGPMNADVLVTVRRV